MRDMTQSREPEIAREISRQAFLRGAIGALAAGAVFGSASAAAAPIASGWDGLSTALGGKVLLPGGPQFATAKQVFNTNYNGFTPAAIVTPTSQADVQKAMAFAAANNLKVAPRSGGHSYTGASTANGTMVFDLRQLPGEINYDAATGQVTVTPATSLYAMHEALAAAGRGIPTGTCPSVGAAGHALGGGLGAQSRHAGLLCDQLTSASVVLPGGQAVIASAASNPDLFWALRGGGGGNFGVTTSLTFATFPTKDVDVVNLDFPPQSFARRCSSVGRIGCAARTQAVGRWRTAPPTRSVRTAVFSRLLRPGPVAAWRPPLLRPLECNRPGPRTIHSTTLTW